MPLFVALAAGGFPLIYDLLRKAFRREFGSDWLAGISIVTAVVLGEYLAAAIVVLMLSGGEALEKYAMRNASSVLRALAQRMPSVAHKLTPSGLVDIPANSITIGDRIVIYPHEVCPVDGTVLDGNGVMNEAFLTCEPFQIRKAPGSDVISGAVNGESALTISATRSPRDSRYAKIMQVMREAEQNRPRMRRLGDRLGAWYTPVALGLALIAWAWSGEVIRFLAVLVVATPCPLLIGIPVAVIGSISLAARRSIIIKNPASLEQVSSCAIAIFDKTGTLTYGEPTLTQQHVVPGFDENVVLMLAASLEVYSKHPLAKAILEAKLANLELKSTSRVSEQPGKGLSGRVGGRDLLICGRNSLAEELLPEDSDLRSSVGLECVILIDGTLTAIYRFRDAPRSEGQVFLGHLGPKHQFTKVIIVSGDRESEVRYLADEVGVAEIYADQSPEQKLALVREQTGHARTLYVGDGINDAPAMKAATVGLAIGQNTDVAAEAADVVAMENSLTKVDEFMHISRRMTTIVLQTVLGGMFLSIGAMFFAAAGYLTPVAGALCQEAIDVVAVMNALRAALPPRVITDFEN